MISKADIHIHTKYSGNSKDFSFIPDSISRPEKIIKVAEKKAIDLIAITDHNTIRGGIEVEKLAPSKVIVGEEILTKDGEILGLFLNQSIPPGLSAEETIEKVKEQGGLTVAPHPYSVICSSLKNKIFYLDLDGIEVFNGFHRDGVLNRKTFQENKIIRKASLAGSDAHTERMVGNCYTTFEGESPDDLYKAIKKRKTSIGGSVTPLFQTMLWSWNTGCHIMKKSIADILMGKDIKKNTGLVIGSGLSVIPFMPVMAAIVINRYHTKKVEKEYPFENLIFNLDNKLKNNRSIDGASIDINDIANKIYLTSIENLIFNMDCNFKNRDNLDTDIDMRHTDIFNKMYANSAIEV